MESVSQVTSHIQKKLNNPLAPTLPFHRHLAFNASQSASLARHGLLDRKSTKCHRVI